MDVLVTSREAAQDTPRDHGLPHLLAVLEGIGTGIATVDRTMAVLFANARIGAVLDIPSRTVTRAMSLLDLLDGSALLSEDMVQQVHETCITTINGAAEHQGAVDIGTRDGSRVFTLRVLALGDESWLLCFEETTDRRAAEADALDQATRDPLTGLLTRGRFRSRVVASLAAGAQPQPQPDLLASEAVDSAVLLVDLDRFKSVNDALGHLVGGGLLKLVSKRLHAMLRRDDLLARLGGDEFAVLVSNMPNRTALGDLAARIVDVLGRPYLVDGHLVNIGASIGVALALPDDDDYQTLLRSADLALYDARKSGRSSFRFFTREMDSRASARRSLEIDLRKALALQEFELNYQPQIDLDTNAIAGFEALLRWRHPERGLVSPADFIPLAEEIGLIVPLGEWVMREACREAARWPDGVTVAVNVSPNQFEDLPRLIDCVERTLRLTGLPGRRLEIEITESSLLANERAVLTALRQLKAIDDFGTGYSSLSQLQSFAFDKLKIDRSFVTGDGDLSSQNAIIRAISALGISLGMVTIAEGVETIEQLARIRAQGCSSVQGFLFSRPVAAGQIDRLLSEFPAATPGAINRAEADRHAHALPPPLLQPHADAGRAAGGG